MPAICVRALACSSFGQRARAGDRVGLRADQRQQAALERALVQLDPIADLEAADHVEQRLQGHALGVEQQFRWGRAVARRGWRLRRDLPGLLADGQDPQVAEHLALVRQERRVATLAGAQVEQFVGHLAVEELQRIGSGQGQLAALGAVEHAAVLADGGVLAAQRVRRDRGH